MNPLSRTFCALRKEGITYTLKSILPYVHRVYIRDRLPRRCGELNGVTVRYRRVLDSVLPLEFNHPNPESYEAGLVESLRQNIESGDSVVIIGGGWGVSTVVAAKEAGQNGFVQTYEASPQYVEYITETTQLNNVSDRSEVVNAVVSHSVNIRGTVESKKTIAPHDIPDCDVLVLDCEGAEITILDELSIRPRIIIVESHGHLGSSSKGVVNRLKSLSYHVISRKTAERGEQIGKCVDNDVYVITAVR